MKENKTELDYKQILLYTVVLTLCFLAALKICGFLIRLTGVSGQARELCYVFAELLFALIVWLCFKQTIRQGEKHIFTVLRFLFCFLYLGIPFLVHCGMNVFGGNLKSGFTPVLTAVLRGLSVGICEELIFRGVSFNKLQELFSGRKNVYLISALLSSLVFGLCHFGNLSEQPAAATVMQVYFSFSIGLCFCGIYLFSGTLLIPILLHGIVDVGTFLLVTNGLETSTSFNWMYMGLSSLILVEGLVLVIIYQVRKNREAA